MAPALLSLVAVHGTGTPLGDPIEVGALGQAVGKGAGYTAAPVVLSSVKSCYGHTEGAAGLTGLLLAAQCSLHLCSPPVMHLRNSNVYVDAALRDWMRNSKLAAAIPRQKQAALFAARLTGTSSFGMSGVNAHAAMRKPWSFEEDLAGAASAAKQLLQGQSLWPMAPVHCLLHSCRPTSQHALFSCLLSQPVLAYLWQHQLMGRSTLPAAATWELMAAAANCLTNAAPGLAVCQVTMPQPIYCTPSTVISCSIHYGSAVQLLPNETASGTLSVAASVATVASIPDAGHRTVASRANWMLGSSSTEEGRLCNTVATVPTHVAVQRGHEYFCHPALIQAAAVLTLKVQTIVGCGLYLPAHSQHSSCVLLEAGTATTTLWSSESRVATQVRDLVARPATALVEYAVAAVASPCWKLTWHPAAMPCPPAGTNGTKALLISSVAWPLSAVCSGRNVPDLPLLTMNAVWGAGLSPSNSSRQCPEISLSSDAHLFMLLQSMESKQCMYVQPPGATVDVCAALASYRLVARSSNNMYMSLVTYDQSLVDNSSTCPQPTVALLQGGVHARQMMHRGAWVMFNLQPQVSAECCPVVSMNNVQALHAHCLWSIAASTRLASV